MRSKWKSISGSAVGTSHRSRGEGCQDYAQLLVVDGEERTTLIAACADGAGSARSSAIGASLACLTVAHLAAEAVRNGREAKSLDRETVTSWYDQARRKLCMEALLFGATPREYACTLLLGVIDDCGAAFAQVGDGVIVVGDQTEYRHIFWPQIGEYANSTYFLTDSLMPKQLMFCTQDSCPEKVAFLTDGLQSLALVYAGRTVHNGFFHPLFETLGQCPDPEELNGPLQAFLNSTDINNRTDDDKTLILATRCPC